MIWELDRYSFLEQYCFMKCGFYFYKVDRNMICGLSYCSRKSQSHMELKELK